MKFFIALMIAIPSIASAHCPLELDIDGTTYCGDAQWLNGERKIKGQWQETSELSPQLVAMGEIPQKWIYSKVSFVFWQKGDAHHKPVFIEDLRIFPYMHMENGHHHSTSYQEQWTDQTYLVSAVAFQQMRGCWSFRWTTEVDDALESSQALMNIVEFENLTPQENTTMASFCENPEPKGKMSHH